MEELFDMKFLHSPGSCMDAHEACSANGLGVRFVLMVCAQSAADQAIRGVSGGEPWTTACHTEVTGGMVQQLCRTLYLPGTAFRYAAIASRSSTGNRAKFSCTFTIDPPTLSKSGVKPLSK